MSEQPYNPIGRRGFPQTSVVATAASTGLVAGNASAQGEPAIQAKERWGSGKPTVLVFDVNETLIDFEVMQPLFERIFGDKHALREWLGHLIMYSMTVTLSGLYKDYFSLGQGLLKMVGDIHKVPVKPADVEAIKLAMLTMPAHPDVEQGLTQLKAAGFRLVAFTNSPPVHPSPVENAGLGNFFEREFSIDRVRRS